MPVYHLTLHAYATWMPDKDDGSVHWKRGYQCKDDRLAHNYRAHQREPAAQFDRRAQDILIASLLETAEHRGLRVHAVATDPSHLHAIVSSGDERDREALRNQIKRTLSISLNREVGRRTWFARKGDCRRVWNREHFDYLVDEYLPSHVGVRWDEREGR